MTLAEILAGVGPQDSVINPGQIGPSRHPVPIPTNPRGDGAAIPTWGALFGPPGGYSPGTLLTNPMLNRPSNQSMTTPLGQLGDMMGQNAEAGLQQGMFAPRSSVIPMIQAILHNQVPQWGGESNM